MLTRVPKRKYVQLSLVAVVLLLALFAWTAKAEASVYGWFDYARNGSNINGTLTWKYLYNDVPPIYTVSWRAGSGLQLNDKKDVGWLPSGYYSILGHWDNYSGSAIWGRVWRLSDKYNSEGVLRTALFIHTEETSSNGQNPSIEGQIWTDSNPCDYSSYGCVKVSYSNVGSVHTRWTSYGGSTAHGDGSPYPLSSRLYVH